MWELFDTIQTPFYVYAFEAEKGRLERAEKKQKPRKVLVWDQRKTATDGGSQELME